MKYDIIMESGQLHEYKLESFFEMKYDIISPGRRLSPILLESFFEMKYDIIYWNCFSFTF